MNRWHNILISPNKSILQTIKIIDDEGSRAALVVDENNHLLGMVTDGDVRRCLLRNVSLDQPVATIMNQQPLTASINETQEQILVKLQSLGVFHIPIVDYDRRVVGFETLDSLLSAHRRTNSVVIMAGGMGKRLHPLTVDCPKPMLKVGNKPVLQSLMESFIRNGFKHFYFSVNYKAEMIKDHFQHGEQWNVQIDYLEENQPLGTAGALSLIETPPKEAFFVINADVMTNINFNYLLDYHYENKAAATLCIREHEQMIPYGVVHRDEKNHDLVSIHEKPTHYFFVSAGIYILEPQLLNLLLPNTYCDMPDLLTHAVKQTHRVATFPIREYWLDIGRHEDLARAHTDYEKVF